MCTRFQCPDGHARGHRRGSGDRKNGGPCRDRDSRCRDSRVSMASRRANEQDAYDAGERTAASHSRSSQKASLRSAEERPADAKSPGFAECLEFVRRQLPGNQDLVQGKPDRACTAAYAGVLRASRSPARGAWPARTVSPCVAVASPSASVCPGSSLPKQQWPWRRASAGVTHNGRGPAKKDGGSTTLVNYGCQLVRFHWFW